MGLAALAALILGRAWFGGEDPLRPAPDASNWHHEGITRAAAKANDWSPAAEAALAFHADYVSPSRIGCNAGRA